MPNVVEIKSYGNKAGPLKAHDQTVMVKVTAPVTEKKKTSGLDIVLVLDISGSMKGDKLAKMKKAMSFVLKKLGENKIGDRVAIIPFASEADLTHAKQLARVNGRDIPKWQTFIDNLQAHGNTNMKAGLQVGVDLLRARKGKDAERTSVIFLMSDGVQTHGDAGAVDVSEINVQTFGFGEKHEPKLLHTIAEKSHGGAYHSVKDEKDGNHLTKAFGLVLGRFRSISIHNLKVTFSRQGPVIGKVEPGSFKQKTTGDSVTVDFGDVAREEACRILVLLHLPVARNPEGAKTVLEVKCSYRVVEQTENTVTKHLVHMERTKTADPGEMKPEVMIEQVRRDVIALLHDTRKLAGNGHFDTASDNLAAHLNVLGDITHPKSKPVSDFLATDLLELLELMESKEHYDKHGNAYALAAISSHERQRPTARGNIDDLRLFTTKRVLKYIDQANKLHQNPNAKV